MRPADASRCAKPNGSSSRVRSLRRFQDHQLSSSCVVLTLHERLALTRPIGLGFVASPGSPGGEDLYLGDLARGRGLYASLHPQGLITITGQAHLAEEPFNLLRFEAQPHISVLFAHPTVGVIYLVHYSDRAAELHDADHLLQHHPRVLCVMEDHVGKCGASTEALFRGSATMSPSS